MQYQSFPGVKGGSQSLNKLTALRLPPLTGKRFLDVGCNEGFFCGYALFDGASHVTGMDRSGAAIRKAGLRFPDAEFINQSWDTLPEGPFDVITLLSALHYAEDQADLIYRLIDKLADDGLLVLEISMAPGNENDWIKVKRSIDERYFPTRTKLGEVLKELAWKVVGHSVNQAGDPLQRYVIHVRKLKPYAMLLLQNPGAGKTTIARRLFANSGIPVVSGDRTYALISQGKLSVSDALRTLVCEAYSSATIDKVTRAVLSKGFTEEIVQLWANEAGFRDFVLDSYVPESSRQDVKDTLELLGYFPVETTWDTGARLTKSKIAVDKAQQYQAHLKVSQGAESLDAVQVTLLLKKEFKPLIRWHLDSPASGEWFAEVDSFKVSGWLVPQGRLEHTYEIYVSRPGDDQAFKPQKLRRDVLISLYGSEKETPELWRNQPCGFAVELPTHWLESGFELGVTLSNERIPLVYVANSSLNPQTPKNFGSRFVQSIMRRGNK